MSKRHLRKLEKLYSLRMFIFELSKNLLRKSKKACIGQEVLKSVSPGQQVVKIINDELINYLVKEITLNSREDRPLRVMMVGLHGAGKPVTSAKLAKRMAKDGRSPMLVACDIYRPAAIDQLEILAKQEDSIVIWTEIRLMLPRLPVPAGNSQKPLDRTLYSLDTAGRLQIDEDLVFELESLKRDFSS